ncbi:MAG: hypothetical protein AB1346_06980 [Thermodesulfobacteriota bacterium]
MLTIGIALSKDRMHAVALDGAPASPQIAAAVEVPCREPFGGPGDPAALAEALRNAVPGQPLSGAVITLPPPLTFVRPVPLPVTDLPRARAIHIAELEGNLPIEDDEILSDLLPAAPEAPGTFLAVAARRSFVEKCVEAFHAAGIRVDRVVTDHAALLLLAAGKVPDDALILSSFQDILLLRASGAGVRTARQFPAAMAETPAEILSAVLDAAKAEPPAPPVFAVGGLPASVADAIPGLQACAIPEGIPASHLAACGAALAPLLPKVAGGFSLRTSVEAAMEKTREARRVRIAAIAGSVAALLAIGSLYFSVWTGDRKLDKARAQVRKEFQEAAPEVKSVVQAGTQIREKVASLKRLQKELGTDAPPAADLLSLASKALPQGEIFVREASVEGGRVRLVGEAGQSALVETYRSGLAAAYGADYSVTVQGSEGSAKGTAVRFTILVEHKEDRRAS